MKLSEFKKVLAEQETIGFELPDGSMVPGHFHVTEIGQIVKHFIDCGGTVRNEQRVSFQLWEANDYDHRLHPEKLVRIIELSENTLGLKDEEIEVEYQGATIGKYGMAYNPENGHFLLTGTKTDCLAKEHCGIPDAATSPANVKKKVSLSTLSGASGKESGGGCCTPGSGCC